MATATMIVVVAEEATVDVTTTADTVEMIVTVAMAEIAMITPPVESIAMLAMTDTAAVVAMTDVEAVEDTLIVMREATVAPLARLRQQPPMVILLLVESLVNHTEVEATRMRESPVVNIDC
jgi:hypothetical protein